MARIERRRRLRLVAAVAATAVGVVHGASAEAAPAVCHGTIVITGTSSLDVREAGGQTFVSFDFTGLHDICLRDGTKVAAAMDGRLVQRLAPDGDTTLRFDEVLAYGGGAIGFRGEAALSGGNWQSHVQTVGVGTGPFAGLHAQGSFFPTGPGSFADVLDYLYR